MFQLLLKIYMSDRYIFQQLASCKTIETKKKVIENSSAKF